MRIGIRHPHLATLSITAALGGMIIPALVYLFLQFGESGQLGWGTVMATDTAFVVGSAVFPTKQNVSVEQL